MRVTPWCLLCLLLLGCDRAPRRPIVSGTIETDEAHLASRYGGRVESIQAREGETLRTGQAIMELQATELRERLNFAKQFLAELQAGARPEEIAAAKHDWESITAELAFARLEQQRSAELFRKNAISETERDRALSRANALEKSEAAAKSRYDLLLAGTRPEKIAQAEAQLSEIQTQIAEMRIVAPTNCLLEVLHVKVGDVVPASREVVTVLLTDHLWVRVFVPEPWLGRIKPGQAVQVKVDSFPAETFPGEVLQVNRQAEFTPRNVQTVEERVKQVFGVKIALKNAREQLRAGMSADVTFPASVTGGP